MDEKEFTPITTQEEFNNAIMSRLNREKAKYADYDEMKTKIADYEKQIGDLNNALTSANEKIANHENDVAERDAKIHDFETGSIKTRVAHEMGLSFDAIEFLKGDDEDSIRQSAEVLKNLVGTKKQIPLASTEQPLVDEKTMAFKTMLNNLSN